MAGTDVTTTGPPGISRQPLLLATKLYLPPARQNIVPRPRLTGQINDGLARKMTLISAPAGSGKTTLLSEWIPTSPRCVTWLSLDKGDNDPARFWGYIIGALQLLQAGLDDNALSLLQSPQPPASELILTTLLNELAAFPDGFVLVLDDYHVIENPAIHQSLAFMLDHLPPPMHLMMTTRVDPPLPLSRLRSRNQLTELRVADLRFSPAEVATFFNQVMGLRLSVADVAALEAHTEGWIAGLQLAALSMQGRDDLTGFITAFTGSHRFILDYLTDEVLERRPSGTKNFLLQTSILDRLCGSLCDAVTGQTDSQTTLKRLEQANLFLIPLDDDRRWYRYHHLFAEVLQARLRQSQPELLPELHRRASNWYEAQQAAAEAVQHALAAGEVFRVAGLLERERWALLGRGEIITLHTWLDALPDELVRSRPLLSLAYAWIFSLLEQAEAIDPHLQNAEEALSLATPETPVQADAIRGEIATLRAEIALSRSAVHAAIDLCRQALRLLPPDNILLRGVTTYFMGHAQRRGGHMAEAERAYIAASELGLQTDNLLLALHALANLAVVQMALGRLGQAAETSRRSVQIAIERRRQTWPVAGLAYQGLGRLHYEWNQLEAAADYLRQGIEFGQHGGLTGLEINCRSVMAFTLQAQQKPAGADEMLHHIAVMTERHHHPVYAAAAAAQKARLRLSQGRFDDAVRWAKTCGLGLADDVLPYQLEAGYLTLARVGIAQGQTADALDLLRRLQQSAEAEHRTGSLIEILALCALARQAQGDLPGALAALEQALALAEPEGYIRTFVDEGEPLAALLGRMTSEGGRMKEYVSKLLAAFRHAEYPTPAAGSPALQPSSLSLQPLVEPLSERELEVLRLVGSGQSNSEIGEELFVATGTVKKHINNIFGKLGVSSRTQAVARARELGLL